MGQLLVPLLAFLSVIAVGGAVLVVRAARQRTLQARLFGQHSTYGASDAPAGGLMEAVEQVGRAVTSDKPLPPGLRDKLAQAGFYDESAPVVYQGAQLLLLLLGLGFGGALAFSLTLSLLLRVCVAFMVMAICALLPNLFIIWRRQQRTGEVRRTLPDAIDLLEICVSSGMGLDQAWNAVCDEFRGVSPVLADEMALANLEIHLGAPRADALRHMAQRTGVQDLASLVATLVQSERFGTSVSQALRTYADEMRTERSQRAEEQAEKLAVKLLFPMVLFIFPCMFIVILGPAAIKIYEMFASG
jgi:tight adherence protein C